MAILSVAEIKGSRTGSIDAQWRRTYKRAWRVVTDGPYDIGALGARLAIPVFLGQSYVLKNASNATVEHDNASFATKIDAQIDPACNDDCSWIVSVDYGPYDPTQFPENPLNHPLKLSWGENRFERVVFEDNDSKPVVNSAGDYFDPPVTCDDSRPTLRIVRNEQTYDPIFANSWKDTTNADSFFSFAPGTVKISSILGELEYSPVCSFYYVVTYQFEINANGWAKEILDQGMRQVAGGVKTNIVDDDNTPITSPALLDGKGGKLATGGSPSSLKFHIYQESDFTLLNLQPGSAPGQG